MKNPIPTFLRKIPHSMSKLWHRFRAKIKTRALSDTFFSNFLAMTHESGIYFVHALVIRALGTEQWKRRFIFFFFFPLPPGFTRSWVNPEVYFTADCLDLGRGSESPPPPPFILCYERILHPNGIFRGFFRRVRVTRARITAENSPKDSSPVSYRNMTLPASLSFYSTIRSDRNRGNAPGA